MKCARWFAGRLMLCFPMLISSLPGANPCLSEYKIGVFVRFWGQKPLFSGFSSTKSRFLCFFGLRDPSFQAFWAQNRDFCALLGLGTLVFGHFEHKIEVFVRWLSWNGHREEANGHRVMSICGWEVASGSGGRSLASGRWHRGVCIGKGVSGSGSSKIDIGMRVAGRLLAVGSRHRAVVSS